jgi:hypothetical protein
MNREETLADTVTITLPRCVAFLAVAMVEKLKEPQNAIKPHWENESISDLHNRAEEELAEVWLELEGWLNPGALVKEAADVANFLMMICSRVIDINAWEPPAGYARKPFDLIPSRTNVLDDIQEKFIAGFMSSHDGHGGPGC